MRTLPCLAFAGMLLAPTGAIACDETAEAETESAGPTFAQGFEPRLVVRHGAWLDSEVDSMWSDLEPALFLLRLRRPTGAWVVETWYFRVATDPARAYTFEEMLELRETGQVAEDAEVGVVSDQVLIYARDEAQATRLARAMRPREVPARVRTALLETRTAVAQP